MKKRSILFIIYVITILLIFNIGYTRAEQADLNDTENSSALKEDSNNYQKILPEKESNSKKSDSQYKKFTFKSKLWATKGDNVWKISFPYGDEGRGKSELKYEDMESDMYIFTFEYKPTYGSSLEFSYGFADIDSGTCKDSDWDNTVQFSESKSDIKGDTNLFIFNVHGVIYPYKKQTSRFYLDGYMGYMFYRDKITMTNGRQTLSRPDIYPLVPSLGPFSGLNSQYTFTWHCLLTGIRTKTVFNKHKHPLVDSIGLNADIALIPLLFYEGKGVWNLRDDLAQDPSFKHLSSAGYGCKVESSLFYSPIQNIQLELGYQVLYLEANDGDDITYGASGDYANADLDKVTAFRYGYHASLSVLF